MKNYLLIFATVFLLMSLNANSDELKPEKGVGFKTVNEALAFLKTKSTVTFTVTKPDGWLIANDTSPFAVWSFTPEGHYAYPAVVKREVKQNDKGDVYIEMTALCQAEKEPCDRLIEEFQSLNNKVRENAQDNINK
jgi:outer membrane phospholipase A